MTNFFRIEFRQKLNRDVMVSRFLDFMRAHTHRHTTHTHIMEQHQLPHWVQNLRIVVLELLHLYNYSRLCVYIAPSGKNFYCT